MIIPVRCFLWDKVVGDKWVPFRKRVVEGERPGGVLDDLGLQKYYCERKLLSNVEIN